MKSMKLTYTSAAALLALCLVPVRFAAQEQPQQAGKLQHYTITELGTLGGTFSGAVGIDLTSHLNHGSIAGDVLIDMQP